jgi:hypothetical protein
MAAEWFAASVGDPPTECGFGKGSRDGKAGTGARTCGNDGDVV